MKSHQARQAEGDPKHQRPLQPRWTLNPRHPQEPHMFIELTKTWQGKQPGERLDLADPDAKKLIEDGHAKAIETDLLSKAVEDAMARAAAQFDAAIDKKLKEFTEAQSRSRKNAVPIIFGDNGEG